MSTSQEDTKNAGQPGADEHAEVEEVETVEGSSEEEAPEAVEEGSKSGSIEDLDGDSLRRMIRDLRRENASSRTQLKKVREAQVKSEAEFNALRDDLARREAELTRERVGAAVGVPPELRSRLVGSSEDEILADAKKVAAMFNQSSSFDSAPPSGGLHSNEPPKLSPEEAAAKIRSQRF